ncbi:hypothetical protein JAAARDRAFT_207593 [Jaapia argillacea MUCL 33604]|uniref:Uncharacterized protein n=1 Tax=Jaapia argillacea MUCL 33604 TaxID=933084 RepID=A0A067PR99_9AGAM|nr:hypothetical protein JAAARDRAFT_207593 [Jaapia argillacea MUCL 33604]
MAPLTKPSHNRYAVLVGPVACGKTSLLQEWSSPGSNSRTWAALSDPSLRPASVHSTDTKYTPTLASVESHTIRDVKRPRTNLIVRDTEGLEEYDCWRPHYYRNACVVVFCFAIDDREKFDGLQEGLLQRVKEDSKGIPMLLVGCKRDLRRDRETIEALKKKGLRPVASDEGIQLARAIGALHYFECSAKSGDGVKEVSDYALRHGFESSLTQTLRSIARIFRSASPLPAELQALKQAQKVLLEAQQTRPHRHTTRVNRRDRPLPRLPTDDRSPSPVISSFTTTTYSILGTDDTLSDAAPPSLNDPTTRNSFPSFPSDSLTDIPYSALASGRWRSPLGSFQQRSH